MKIRHYTISYITCMIFELTLVKLVFPLLEKIKKKVVLNNVVLFCICNDVIILTEVILLFVSTH